MEIRALRTKLSNAPDNIDIALALATRLIEQSRAEADPRFLGQAQAVLTPWLTQPEPPASALLVRAMIRQNAHEFDLALADLDTVLSLHPANAQAWLTKASILQVQGQYEQARRSCQRLFRITARHVGLTCVGDIDGLTGQVSTARAMLAASLAQPGISPRTSLWTLTILADLAVRTGDSEGADRYFTEALNLHMKDQYLLGAYADFLLDQQRAREVVSLLQRETRADGMLLRLALAEQALQLPASHSHTAELAARFAAGQARGSQVHLREEARFALGLLRDSHKALRLAQANWGIQKEPWDARLLLECALAVGSRNAAKPVIDWINANHVEDLRLRRLVAQLQKENP